MPPKVRVLPRGVSGQDLGPPGIEALVPGSLWNRGRQRVRVIAIHERPRRRFGGAVKIVQFKELTFGSRIRYLVVEAFLSTSAPDLSDPDAESGAEGVV
jgi:hypothetical protein